MGIKKMSLANIQGRLSRAEMMNIMAGSEESCGQHCSPGCPTGCMCGIATTTCVKKSS